MAWVEIKKRICSCNWARNETFPSIRLFTLPFIWKIVITEKNSAARRAVSPAAKDRFYRICALSPDTLGIKCCSERAYVRLPIRKLRRQWDHCCPRFICMRFSIAFFFIPGQQLVTVRSGSRSACFLSNIALENKKHFSLELFGL